MIFKTMMMKKPKELLPFGNAIPVAFVTGALREPMRNLHYLAMEHGSPMAG